RAQQAAHAVRSAIDRAERERQDRPGHLKEPRVHVLMHGGARRKPAHVLKMLVQGTFLVIRRWNDAYCGEYWPFHQRFDRSSLDAPQLARPDERRGASVGDRVEIAESLAHSSSSGISMTKVRPSVSVGADVSMPSWASSLRYSLISRSRAKRPASRSVNSCSPIWPSSSCKWSPRSSGRTGS